MASSSSSPAPLHSRTSLYCRRFPVLSGGNLRSFPVRLLVRTISSGLSQIETVRPVLIAGFNYSNIHQVPKVDRIVVNCGLGEAAHNPRGLAIAMNDMAIITGQKPVKKMAKKPILGSKSREVQAMGIAVTLRGNVMYSFLDRLINLGLPRAEWDFDGVNANNFDGRGNCRLVLPNKSVFPELSSDSLFKEKGVNVCIATTANSDAEARKLLSLMGMPLQEGGSAGAAPKKKKRKSPHFVLKSKQRGRR